MSNIPTTNPFQGSPLLEANACIGYERSFGELSKHYRRSADALVEVAVQDGGTLDVHVYAICFLYRHCLELQLKDNLWMTEYALSGRRPYRCEDKGVHLGHQLRPIWDSFSKSAMQLLSSDFPLTVDEMKYIDAFLNEWTRHDNQSDAFRYPLLRKKNDLPLAGLSQINIRDLRAAVHHSLELLERVMYLVEYCYDQRAELEASNRHN